MKQLVVLALWFSWNAAHAQSASSPRLPLARLLGEWTVVESSFSAPDAATKATFVATPAAGGTAVYSVWRQGTGAATYEANAVWSHHAGTGVVRVFEVNSLGAADMHTGRFLGSDSLQLELRDGGASSPTQRRLFVWSADTLRMSAQFSQNDRIVNHAIVLVRRRSPDASREFQAVRAGTHSRGATEPSSRPTTDGRSRPGASTPSSRLQGTPHGSRSKTF